MTKFKKFLTLTLSLLVILSAMSFTSSAALAKVSDLVAYNIDDDEINLKWNSVKSADGYQVYIYNEGTKKWTKLGNTKKTAFEVDDLLSAKQYKFRVRAYDKTASGYVYSPYVTVTAATEPDEVDALKASAVTKTSVTLKWNAVRRATGYQVYIYSETKGKYVRKTAVTATTAKITGRKEGTSYKFMVRAYFKEADGTSRYGEFSDVLTVKTSGTAAAQAGKQNVTDIGAAKAGTIALEHAKLTKNQVKGFECKLDRENGTTVYEVEFDYGKYEYEYEINAATGKIISVEKSRNN